jgi:hypothetical protein
LARGSNGKGVIVGLLGFGVLLHQVHEAVDGYEWLAELCVWCRMREQGS